MPHKKLFIVAVSSVALNIFLISFLLGRFSVFPPPFLFPPPHGMNEMMPPPLLLLQGEHGMDPQVAQKFSELHALRMDLADILLAQTVDKNRLQENIDKADMLMTQIKDSGKKIIFERLSTMPLQERKQFINIIGP